MEQILGKKIGMTQIFTQKGDCVPVTVIQVERCIPVERKTLDKQGYDAVVVAYGDRKPKHTNKPLKGYYDKLKIPPAKLLREFRGQEVADEALGQPLKVDMFGEGDRVDVIGASKGRGFAGVMKRWGFHGKPASTSTRR